MKQQRENSVHPVSRIRSLCSSRAIVAGFLLCYALELTACAGSKPQAGANARPPVAVKTVLVTRRTLDDAEILDGQVVPYLQANLATETSGTVVAVYANQGDHVHAGEVLAKIDDAPLQAQLAQQQGSMVQAQAKLQQSQIQQPITNQSAQSALAEAQLTVTQARKQLLADEAAVHQNELTYQADQALFRQGYVAATTLATAHSSYVASQQTLEIDQSRVTQAQAAMDAAKQSLLSIPLQKQVVAENRGAVQQADGSTKLLRTQIGQTLLTAPFDGVVTQRLLDPGAYAGPNQPVFSLAEISPVYITFNLKDTDLAFVHPGSTVQFTTASVPNQVFSGNVSVINVVPTTGTLLYPARLVFANPGELLKGGMLVAVRAVKNHVQNALSVPLAALTQGLDGAAVYAVSGTGQEAAAKKIPVTVGIQTPEYVQVTSPALHEGMSVITNKPDLLQDGANIAVVQ